MRIDNSFQFGFIVDPSNDHLTRKQLRQGRCLKDS